MSYLQTLDSSPPLQGEKWSSQPSSELLASKVCLAAEKVEEKERKWEKRKAAGKTPAHNFINGEDLFLTMLVRGFYSQIPLQITKKPKLKAITRDKFGRKLKREQHESKR